MQKRLVPHLLLFIGLFCNTTAWAQEVPSSKQPDSTKTSQEPFMALAQGKDTQGAYSMSEITAVHLSAPLHQHKTYTESFYVLAGYLTIYLDGKTERLGPGSFLMVPKGTPHTVGNPGGQPVRFLVTVSPSALFDGFITEQAELTKTLKPNHPDFRKRINELFQKYDMEVLGPSPIAR